MGYRLDVVADSVAEAVRQAGGLMFDRCRAGWQVVVVTTDDAHADALTILGVRAESRGAAGTEVPERDRRFRTVVGPLGLFATGPEICADSWLLWGDELDEGPTGVLQPVRHQLSAAARAFKGQALRRAGLPLSDAPEERFWLRDPAPSPAGPDRSGARSPTGVGG